MRLPFQPHHISPRIYLGSTRRTLKRRRYRGRASEPSLSSPRGRGPGDGEPTTCERPHARSRVPPCRVTRADLTLGAVSRVVHDERSAKPHSTLNSSRQTAFAVDNPVRLVHIFMVGRCGGKSISTRPPHFLAPSDTYRTVRLAVRRRRRCITTGAQVYHYGGARVYYCG
jgi:rRNA maturation protein Nop10